VTLNYLYFKGIIFVGIGALLRIFVSLGQDVVLHNSFRDLVEIGKVGLDKCDIASDETCIKIVF
jgi:hypothetical protein